MKKSSQTTVHTHIGHDRALCGVNPNRGHYKVVSFSEFFAAKEKDQCGSCIRHLKLRGYNIRHEREKFQAIHCNAQQYAAAAQPGDLAA